ncbi:hypothetical protein [Roseibacillus ishigakijimensis]|uniref:hypothetical protein n=1 Tax=Roseibacillus ishigakijimensis TaxID=454146 RepID=UPI001905A125|nr:hypothetical protein [Roseibacillus ishigakijimensis]
MLAEIPQRFTSVSWAFEGEQEVQVNSAREIGVGFLGALVMTYVLIAVPVKSPISRPSSFSASSP